MANRHCGFGTYLVALRADTHRVGVAQCGTDLHNRCGAATVGCTVVFAEVFYETRQSQARKELTATRNAINYNKAKKSTLCGKAKKLTNFGRDIVFSADFAIMGTIREYGRLVNY